MSVKHKFDVFKKMYDILMILVEFVEISHDFGWYFATRIRFMNLIRLTKMKRTHPDPDTQHWFIGLIKISIKRLN